MRRLMAILLLFAIGLSAPAVANDAVICLAALLKSSVVDTDCCDDCQGNPEQRDPCCLELNQLPDAQTPDPAPSLPEIPVMDLPLPRFPLPEQHAIRLWWGNRSELDPPLVTASRRRALLENWRN